VAGYTGDIHNHRLQKNIKRQPIESTELLNLLRSNNKLKEISLAFKEIDPEFTGMITSTEMDDIFRHFYPVEFKDRHVFEFIKPFEIISNKILIDYNKMRKWLVLELKKTQKEYD